MKSNIGKDSQALVRDARNAWRANSGGAAGPVPAVAAMIRLLFGQMMPHTLSIIMTPMAPPRPMESVLLLAQPSPFTVSRNPDSLQDRRAHRNNQDDYHDCEDASVLRQRRHFLDDQKFDYKQLHRECQPDDQHHNRLMLPPPNALAFSTSPFEVYIAK